MHLPFDGATSPMPRKNASRSALLLFLAVVRMLQLTSAGSSFPQPAHRFAARTLAMQCANQETAGSKNSRQKIMNKTVNSTRLAALAASRAASDAAKRAVRDWLTQGASKVEREIPRLQQQENLKAVQNIPAWSTSKSHRDGYVMLRNPFTAEDKPVVLQLDYDLKPAGALTERSLYTQVRACFSLPNSASLRLVPARPWHRFGNPIPEAEAIAGRKEFQCTHLLGTTLHYYSHF